MQTIKFEIREEHLGQYFFNLFVFYQHFSGHKTLAGAGRDLIQAGLRSKDAHGLIHSKIELGAVERGITIDEYKKMILAEHGIDNDYRPLLKKHNCQSFDELVKLLD